MNEKILEEYSVKIYEIDPYFYEHHKEKVKVDKNGHEYILFRIDVYFTRYFLAVEIDEQNHKGRDLIFAKKRQETLEKKLGRIFVRINTSDAKRGYGTGYKKDKTPALSQSSIVYKFNCPGCNSAYIGKTDRTLFERTEEHAYNNPNKNDRSAIYEHISTCPNFCHVHDIFRTLNNDVNINKFNIAQIRDSTVILDKAANWNVLLFKEALYIKRQKPSLNSGLKASKELQLF